MDNGLTTVERNTLVTRHLKLPAILAAKAGFPGDLDAIQEGALGLVEAARRYDPGHASSVKFSTYAAFWVQRFVMRHAMARKVSAGRHLSTWDVYPDGEEEYQVPDTTRCPESAYSSAEMAARVSRILRTTPAANEAALLGNLMEDDPRPIGAVCEEAGFNRDGAAEVFRELYQGVTGERVALRGGRVKAPQGAGRVCSHPPHRKGPHGCRECHAIRSRRHYQRKRGAA